MYRRARKSHSGVSSPCGVTILDRYLIASRPESCASARRTLWCLMLVRVSTQFPRGGGARTFQSAAMLDRRAFPYCSQAKRTSHVAADGKSALGFLRALRTPVTSGTLFLASRDLRTFRFCFRSRKLCWRGMKTLANYRRDAGAFPL
jgi:hypothetical protein